MSNTTLEELAEKINQKFRDNQQLAPYSLKARVYANGTVQIQGIVDVLEEKLQAEELVRNFPGVKKVENNITVCTDGGIDDFDVAFEVSEEIHANPQIPASVGVKVSGGEVQLVGRVNNYNQAREALEAAAKARGVREVVNHLKLYDSIDDTSLNNSIQAAFMTELGLIPGRIKTLIHNGVVTLQGNLPENQVILATETAAKVPGVKRIKNLLNQQSNQGEDQIVLHFMNEIAVNPVLNRLPIGIEVTQGRIIITGEIDSLRAKKDIEEIIHQIPTHFKQDIYKIDNQLRLAPEI